METKNIVERLRFCANENHADCGSCNLRVKENGVDCYNYLKLLAAARLVELEAQPSEQQSEWISVEDEPIPSDGSRFIFTMLPAIVIKRHPETGQPAYWMRLEPPKPKAPTFKDVFLGSFPKANTAKVIPFICVKNIFPQFKPAMNDCAKYDCEKCWNQPYFEEKE